MGPDHAIQSAGLQASKEHGKYPYNVATVPLMSELMKLILSSFLLYQQYTKDPKATQVGSPPRTKYVVWVHSIQKLRV